MIGLEDFKSRFHFNPSKAFLVGVERECFIANAQGIIVPDAPRLIEFIRTTGWRDPNGPVFGALADPGNLVSYELSACQIETRSEPTTIGQLESHLAWVQDEMEQSLLGCGLRPLHIEVAPDSMPLDVYPDPSGRYAQVTARMPRNVLLAACQVAGTHIHIGMPDHETALRVYNAVIPQVVRLANLGDHSDGRRLAIYRTVAPACDPMPYASWDDYYQFAKSNGFDQDPRSCWTLVRISVHGTIEFRMFGVTRSVKEVAHWAKECRDLCLAAAG